MILFDITHPQNVHLFRHAIGELESEGHKITVTSRDKDVTLELLEYFSINHRPITRNGRAPHSLPVEWIRREIGLFSVVKEVEPDVIISQFNPAAAHVSFLLNKKSIQFDDTEWKPYLIRKLTYPFVDQVYTPECFNRNLDTAHRRYSGYHELAYLHPNRFTPQPFFSNDMKTTKPVVVIRLVSFSAHHDIGEEGINNPMDIIQTLERMGATVIISSESELPNDLAGRRYQMPVHRVHDVLYAADLFIGESATMAAESAVLGTPAIYMGSSETGYVNDIEEKYNLLYHITNEKDALRQAKSILWDSNIDWEERRQKLLNDNVDTTEIITNAILREISAKEGAEID